MVALAVAPAVLVLRLCRALVVPVVQVVMAPRVWRGPRLLERAPVIPVVLVALVARAVMAVQVVMAVPPVA